MRVKKVLASVLSISVLSIYPLINANANPIESAKLFTGEELPISTQINQASYPSFSGTVKEIEVTQPAEGSEALRYIFVENAEGQVAYFVVTDETYILNEDQLEIGATVTGFYDASKPVIMIYPPHYSVEVLAVNQADNIKVDVFDQNLVSADGMLKLNISTQTEVVTQDGRVFEGKLGSQRLVVLFGSSTRSIPAQTTPSKVIVLQEDDKDGTETAEPNLSKLQTGELELQINGQKIKVSSAYVNSNGTLMVPLRAVVERLNLKVTWDKALAQVIVDDKFTLTIGQDKYLTSESKVISLGASPELKEGKTFVPLNFFEEVLGSPAVCLNR